MGVINQGTFAELMWPGIDKIYGLTYKEYPEEHRAIFEYNKSQRAYEEILGMSGFGLAPVMDDGGSVTYSTMKQGFKQRATMIKYGLGFIITRDAYDDNLYQSQMKIGGQLLAMSMRQTKETVGANILNRGFSGSYLYSDGVALLSASHPNVSGGTWSNLATADLDEESLEAGVTAISLFTNDAGNRIALKPKALVVPPALQFEATRILESIGQNDTANNAINALRTMGSIPKVIVNHYLSDTDAWFIQTDAMNGLIYYERRADDFTMDSVFDSENAKYKAVARYAFTAGDPRCIYGSAGV